MYGYSCWLQEELQLSQHWECRPSGLEYWHCFAGSDNCHSRTSLRIVVTTPCPQTINPMVEPHVELQSKEFVAMIKCSECGKDISDIATAWWVYFFWNSFRCWSSPSSLVHSSTWEALPFLSWRLSRTWPEGRKRAVSESRYPLHTCVAHLCKAR